MSKYAGEAKTRALAFDGERRCIHVNADCRFTVTIECKYDAKWHAARSCIGASRTCNDEHIGESVRSAALSQVCTHQNTARGSG